DAFALDLTEMARQGKLDPFVGRLSESEQLLQVLGCRTRNGALLLGEEGVGKAALVHGLAESIAGPSGPALGRERRVRALDRDLWRIAAQSAAAFREAVKASL